MSIETARKEVLDHYVHASKGDLARALLLALDAGFSFNVAVGAMGDQGIRAAFRCIVNGWIERGELTDQGRAQLAKGADA